MSKSLKDKTVNGLSWSFIDNIANQGLTFVVGIVLARLLTPQEYGLIGIILIFISVFNSIVDSGFSSALIRKKTVDHVDYNTVFIFNILLSAGLFGVLVLFAPAIGRFFKHPEITLLLRATAIIVVINAFGIIQRTILVRKVDFKTQTKISIIASTSSGAVGIAMAYGGFGVWSLAAQQILRQLLNTIFLWVFSRGWKPKNEFSWKSFGDLFHFGWKIMAIGLIHTLWEELYQTVIGKCYSTATLGQFTRSNQFRNIFSRNLTTVIQRVSYPVLSTIQDDIFRLRTSFRRVIKVTALVTFTCMIMIGAIAKSMVLTLIGAQWLPAAIFLQIICFSGMWNPMQALNVNLMQVTGKSGLLLKLEIPIRILALIPVILGILFEIEWMLWGSVVINFLIYAVDAFAAGRLIGYPLFEQLKDILPSFIIALITGGVMWMLSLFDLHMGHFSLLVLQTFSGLIVFVGISEIFNLEEYREIKEIIHNYLVKLKILKSHV